MDERQKTYIDIDELTVRIGEACMGNQRPKGMTAPEAIRSMKHLCPEGVAGFSRAALAAAKYIAECCNANHPGSVEVQEIVLPRPGGMIL